jgi:predicted dehydrogenase
MGPVGVGMLGSGFIGEFHTLGLRHVADARLVVNYGAGPERRESFAARFGSRPVAAYRSMRSGRWEPVTPDRALLAVAA